MFNAFELQVCKTGFCMCSVVLSGEYRGAGLECQELSHPGTVQGTKSATAFTWWWYGRFPKPLEKRREIPPYGEGQHFFLVTAGSVSHCCFPDKLLARERVGEMGHGHQDTSLETSYLKNCFFFSDTIFG